MKLAMIVVRPNMYYATNEALADNGFFFYDKHGGNGAW